MEWKQKRRLRVLTVSVLFINDIFGLFIARGRDVKCGGGRPDVRAAVNLHVIHNSAAAAAAARGGSSSAFVD